MKDCYRPPIIINLGECMSDRAHVARVVKRRFDNIKSSAKKCMLLGPNSKKNSNVYMMSECDEVLKNDFKWLINFNLEEMPIYDIDKKLPGNNLLKVQKSYRRRESKKKGGIKHSHNYSLSDVIQQCLFIHAEATIKEINKWISDAFPCFKSNDCTWKNSVRKTLLNNPIFKKGKLKLGKSHLWCLDENYLRETSYIKETFHEPAKANVRENDLIQLETSKDIREITTAIHTMQESIPSDENVLNTNIHDIPANTMEIHLSATWIESRELKENHCIEMKAEDLMDCYKMPAEFQDENGEPVEVHLLDENNMPILIDLI